MGNCGISPTKWSYGPLLITGDGAHLAPSPCQQFFAPTSRFIRSSRSSFRTSWPSCTSKSWKRSRVSTPGIFVTSQANRSISIRVTVQVQMSFFISPTSINVTISFWECRAKIGESLRMSLHMCVHISFQWFTPPVPLSRCHLTSRCLKVMATIFFQWDMQRDWHRKTNNTAEGNSLASERVTKCFLRQKQFPNWRRRGDTWGAPRKLTHVP